VYNTNNTFSEFRKGSRDGLSGKGIYFLKYPLPMFGQNRMAVFLNIRNPITRETELEGMRERNSAVSIPRIRGGVSVSGWHHHRS